MRYFRAVIRAGAAEVEEVNIYDEAVAQEEIDEIQDIVATGGGVIIAVKEADVIATLKMLGIEII